MARPLRPLDSVPPVSRRAGRPRRQRQRLEGLSIRAQWQSRDDGGVAVVASLGLDGARLRSAHPPAIGSRVTLTLRVPMMATTATVPATVRWHHDGHFGVQLGLLDASTTHAICRLLEHRASLPPVLGGVA